MSLTILLVLAAMGALIIPNLGGGEDDSDSGEIRGTLGDDEIEGTSGDDIISGFDGADVINGGAGLDFINAGLGDDTVNGGDDRDVIEGRDGNDTLNGDGGDDTIEGGEGNDIIDGGPGDDIVRGGRGADIIKGGSGTDTLRGEGGDDTIYLSGGAGEAFGGTENDELIMVTGRGEFEGGAGDDTFYALANDDDDQQTVAILTDFNPVSQGDRIVMTVDTGDVSALGADLTVEVSAGTLNGVDGYNVDVAFADAGQEPANFEASRVFIYGTSLTPQQIIDAIEVAVTNDASLDDPETTLEVVKLAATDPVFTI